MGPFPWMVTLHPCRRSAALPLNMVPWSLWTKATPLASWGPQDGGSTWPLRPWVGLVRVGGKPQGQPPRPTHEPGCSGGRGGSGSFPCRGTDELLGVVDQVTNAHIPSGSLLHLYLRALCRRNSGGLSARVGGGRDPPGQILQGLTSHPPTPLPWCVHTLTQSYRVCSALRSERWPPLGTQGDCSHHRLWEAHSGHWVGRGWGSARGQGQGDADGGVHSEPCPRAGAGLAQAQALREAPCPTLPPQQAPWSSGQVSPDPSSQGVRGAAGVPLYTA